MCAPEYDRDFNKIMKLLGREDLVDHPDYSNCDRMNALHKNREVVEVFDEAIGKYTLEEIRKIFKDADVPCEACYEPLDVYDDEQVWANDVMTKLDCPSGKRNIPLNPVKFGSYYKPDVKVSRAQGSDTESVMKELGYSDEQIGAYISEGAVQGKKALGS